MATGSLISANESAAVKRWEATSSMDSSAQWGILDYAWLLDRTHESRVGLEVVLQVTGDFGTFPNELELHMKQLYSRPVNTSTVEPRIEITDFSLAKTELEEVLTLNLNGIFTDYTALRPIRYPLVQFWIRKLPYSRQLRLTARLSGFLQLMDYFEHAMAIIAEHYSPSPKSLYVKTFGSRDVPDYAMWDQATQKLETRLEILLQPETQQPIEARPKGFPKRQNTVDKWAKSYQAIIEKRQEYRLLYDDGQTDEPNPSIEDLRDTLASMDEWNKKPCASTVRRIMKAGDKGWLP